MHPLAREDEITLSHGGFTVRLRASLRAAIRLERLHDGFGPLFRKLEQFDTATVRQIILAASTNRSAAEAFLSATGTLPLSQYQKAVTGPLVTLCAALLPEADDTAPASTDQRPSKPMTWAEAFAELYQIGTGWLGWTPAATLAATPAEISEALTGFVAMQQAMHGTAERADTSDTYTAERLQEIEELGHDPAFDRAGLHSLKGKL